MIIATKIRTLGAVAVVGLFGVFAGPQTAQATLLSFGNISANDVGDAATGEAQLTVNVTETGTGQVSFVFANSGSLASSITDVYFDDGSLLGIASIINDPGVAFSQPATPGDLPSGNSITPAFETTAEFSADSDPPVESNGVNPGESLEIIFALQEFRTFADVETELLSGALRIGIHVQGFDGDGSESFVNFCDLGDPACNPTFRLVPEPTTLLLFGIGLLGLGGVARRRRKLAA